MGADLDFADLHLSIRNAITQQPYITSDGQISLNMPYESCDWTDVMYEAKVAEIPTAKIVLPSLLAFPELRPLHQLIQEGDRVELYGNQPDCGDPVFAGFVPPNGITEADGKTTLDVQDTQAQLRWQHLRRFEYLSGPAATLYDRARSIWTDLVNTDFTEFGQGVPPSVWWYSPTANAVATTASGFIQITSNNASPAAAWLQPIIEGDPAPSIGPKAIIFQPGDVYLTECDAILNAGVSGKVQVGIGFYRYDLNWPVILGYISYQPSGVGAFPSQLSADLQMFGAGAVNPSYDPGGAGIGGTTFPSRGTNALAFPMPQSHHLATYVRFNFDGTASVYVYLDNIQVAFGTQPWLFDGSAETFTLLLKVGSSTDSVTVTKWRCRKLLPALLKAGRFNPQTVDALTYQPNNEENLQFLQLIAEKDNAEYRPIYRAWPKTDELELDATGTLGKLASRVLGYEQPSSLPSEGSPQASPVPVVTDVATFLTTPPFRFEEGYNLEAPPKVLARANAHSNDVIRVGAATQDAQVFAEKWAVAETGRPQQSPSGALFPYFEQITNDDRVGIQTLNASLASGELSRRIDPTPSIEVAVIDEVPWAFRWRAGDQVFTKTLSLRTNVEQELRVQKVQYKAGSPVRTVTLGKTDWDPTMLRMLSESMKISWLYEQSGTNPGIYIYPSLGNINSGATSAVFSIPLDQYTTGSALVYAALHWFADANVMNIQPILNGTGVYTTGLTSPSGTDSGLVICTQYLQSPGTYQLQFKNNDGSTRNLTGAFLVLRIKA